MNIVDEMKERVPMRELLESYGIQPVRGNNIYRCFVHDDEKPSANIIKGKEIFHCFGCQYSADIFDVVKHFEKCDFKKSLKIIDDRFGLGLMHELTRAEKLELTRMQKERERLKREKEEQARFEKATLNKIVSELRFWEKCESITTIQKGEYRATWSNSQKCDLHFYSLKKQKWLNWLFETICDFKDKQECEFDFIYPTDKQELLKAIKDNKIFI